jgi:hypothetical protein
MPTNLPDRKPAGFAARVRGATGQQTGIAAILCVPAAAVILVILVPGPLLLPAFSTLLVAVGFTLAMCAWRIRTARRAWGDDLMHFAAGLVFLGFAASILTDGQTALKAFDDFAAGVGGQAPSPHWPRAP